MIAKEIQDTAVESGEIERTKKVKVDEVDAEDKTVEESARDPSSTVSDSSCQSSFEKHSPLPGRTRGPARRSTKGRWTEEEDEILTRAVKQFKGKNWKKIAELFPGRSDVQCLHRWQKVLDPKLVKGAWTKEEDECIIALVNKYGAKKWAVISSNMPGRIGKQCRERWHNHLNPAIKKCAWTTEEEIILIRAHEMYGNKWAEIAKFLPGRADNSIKNHWNCSVKKKLDKYSASGLLDRTSDKICPLDVNTGSSVVREPRHLMEVSRSPSGAPDDLMESVSPTGSCATHPPCGEESCYATPHDHQTAPRRLIMRSLFASPEELEGQGQSLTSASEQGPPIDHDQSSVSRKNIRKMRSLDPGKLSPEIILRKAARTFRNTPSIISKGHKRQRSSPSPPTTPSCSMAVDDSTPKAESVASSISDVKRLYDAQHIRRLFSSSDPPTSAHPCDADAEESMSLDRTRGVDCIS